MFSRKNLFVAFLLAALMALLVPGLVAWVQLIYEPLAATVPIAGLSLAAATILVAMTVIAALPRQTWTGPHRDRHLVRIAIAALVALTSALVISARCFGFEVHIAPYIAALVSAGAYWLLVLKEAFHAFRDLAGEID